MVGEQPIYHKRSFRRRRVGPSATIRITEKWETPTVELSSRPIDRQRAVSCRSLVRLRYNFTAMQREAINRCARQERAQVFSSPCL